VVVGHENTRSHEEAGAGAGTQADAADGAADGDGQLEIVDIDEVAVPDDPFLGQISERVALAATGAARLRLEDGGPRPVSREVLRESLLATVWTRGDHGTERTVGSRRFRGSLGESLRCILEAVDLEESHRSAPPSSNVPGARTKT
jgi:hypothetical protein